MNVLLVNKNNKENLIDKKTKKKTNNFSLII